MRRVTELDASQVIASAEMETQLAIVPGEVANLAGALLGQHCREAAALDDAERTRATLRT